MKLYVPCIKCAFPDIPEKKPTLHLYPAQIPDGGVLELTCACGHPTSVILANPKYQLLYLSGASALLDGYPREAVASFAASVERFYEFAAKCLLIAGGVQVTLIDEAWKTISKQSERQLGAFRILHLLTFKECAAHLEKRTEFRNRVVHNGMFPSQEEAIEYGEACLRHIDEIWKKLKTHSDAAVGQMEVIEQQERSKGLPKDRARSSYATEAVLHQQRGNGEPVSLTDWLNIQWERKRSEWAFQRLGSPTTTA